MRRPLLIEALVVSRPHIVAIAALAALTFGFAFTGERPALLAAICGFDWFLINLLNRVTDVVEDDRNGIAGTALVAANARTLRRAYWALLLGSLVALAFVVPAITPLRLLVAAIGYAYSVPLIPGHRRIKDFYFWKNTASAALFLLTVFGYPLAAASRLASDVDWLTLALFAGFFALFELSYEVIYDLRDVEGDRLVGLATYPVVHGVPAAARIVEGLIVASFLLLAGGWLAGLVPWRLAIMGAAPLIQLLFFRRVVPRGVSARDCIALTWIGAALLFVYHVWVELELPGVSL